MPKPPRTVDNAIARFDDYAARLDGHTPAARRHYGRQARSWGKRLGNIGIAIAALVAVTIGWGLVIGPIGLGGLFLLIVAIFFVMIFFSAIPAEKAEKPFNEKLPNRDVVQSLDSFLHRRRMALPAPAGRQVDAIAQRLPLLESRLGEVDVLDPLAQDARRLMGKHLPELIERYERVPTAYRQERDGEGMTVDERLTASLDAARTALDDIGLKLAKQDMDAFETQGRFIENRYKEGDELKE